jgi:class 3 adenylate cyclase/tetratricopeptide (TPR) repeat protein
MSGTAVCPTCGVPVAPDASFCSACGTALGEAAREERKLATILFADVIGSTDLGERLDPERLRALLGDYFAAMAAVVKAWGGTVEKYIGDAILAVWGVPTAREDDVIRALRAARDMIAALEPLNDEFETRHGVRLGVRIGVNTGEVIAPVESRPGGQFLVSGDAVNVAARLEQSAEAGGVLVGERTWLNARDAFEFSDPWELTVKGKRSPIAARRLGQELAVGRDTSSRAFQAPMVGRDRELGTLLGLLDEAVESGEPRLVLVSGPAGIGKSRMLREFISAASNGVADLTVLRGRCLATGRGITFWALSEILRLACAISLDEPAESAAEKLERRVVGPLAAIGLSHAEIAETIAALATSANLPLSHDPFEGLDPEDLAEQMSRAWPRLLTGFARANPLTVLVEDIHWADERMLRMLEALATRSEGAVLVIATARPEFLEAQTGFGAGADLSVVALRPLTDAQSERLIDDLLGSEVLPRALVEEMRRKADGNPFFVEEMIQRLIDEGALIQSDGRWRATERASTVELPDTIYALLVARIDALPHDEKQLLQEAAVVGRVFWPGALAKSVPADLMDVLRRVERRGLIAVRPASTIENQPEYAFRHVLIRDVAYGSVPKKRRARAHAETGAWVEQLVGDRTEEFGELIAFHYAAAVTGDDVDLAWSDDAAGREAIRRRAFEMLVRAGASARRRFAVDKALELHQQALDLAADDQEPVRVHEELGDDYEALFRGDEAVREYLAAVDLLVPSGAPHRISETAVDDARDETLGRLAGKAGRMVLRWGTFREPPPLDLVQALVDSSLHRRASDRVRATLLMVNGGLLPGPTGAPIATGRMPVAAEVLPTIAQRIESIEEGIALARAIDDVDLQYLGAELLTTAYQAAGDRDRARESTEHETELLERLTSRRQQVDLLVGVAAIRTEAGAFAAALDAAEDAFRRSVGLSAHERMHAAYELVAAADALGRWDRIEEVLPWFAEAASAEQNITCVSVRAGPPYGAVILGRRGNAGHAIELVPVTSVSDPESLFATRAFLADYASLAESNHLAREAVRTVLASSQAGFFALGVAPLIEAMSRLEMLDELADFLPLARSQADAVALVQPTIDRAEGLIALTRGAGSDAQRSLRAALARFEELGTPFEVAQTQELLARATDGAESQTLLRAALSGYESLDARPYAQGVRRRLEADKPAAAI